MSDDEGEVYAYSDDGGSDVDYAYGSDEVSLGAGGMKEEGKEEKLLCFRMYVVIIDARLLLRARALPARFATFPLTDRLPCLFSFMR